MAERVEPEPERYELNEPPPYHFEFGRRDFLRGLSGGILVMIASAEARPQESGGAGGRRGEGPPRDLAAWLHVGEDGIVTVYTGKVEVGQDIRTSLSQHVAEELPVGLAHVKLVMADTALTPYDAGTFGSRSTPQMGSQLRRVAAAARLVLLRLAADEWKAEPATLRMEDGRILHPDGKRTLAIGALAKAHALTATIDDDTPLIAAEHWKIAGVSTPKIDGRDVVTGRRQYTSDLQRPGMLAGKVLRPPSFGAKLKTLDARAAEASPGVTVVRDGDLVGVAAPTAADAARAIEQLRAEWDEPAQPAGADLFDILKKGGAARSPYQVGSVEEGLAAAVHKLRATYTVAYIAHVPLEPRAAVAEWSDGKLTVWTGTQRPFGVRADLAQAFHLDEANVRVIVPDTGSGYGGKHTGDAAMEAARLAKAAGKPVKVAWTRAEELTWAYFRPAGVIDIASGAKGDGTLAAWEHHNYNSGSSGIRTPYEVPHQTIAFHEASTPLRQGSYRGLAATANHFARESHMDELAHAAGLDPLAFRRQNLKDRRLLAVLDAAAERFRWGAVPSSPERGFGLAIGTEKGGYVASGVEVAIDPRSGQVKIARVVTAFECGAIVNPDHLKNQVEGAVVMGLGGALFEQIEFDRGKILNARLSHYRVPRFRDLPALETILLDRKDLPSAGAGETPIVAVAPAIANAIFSATNVRLRSLPLIPGGTVKALPSPSRREGEG
jgi:nicotinate dehydrogenase subunit B